MNWLNLHTATLRAPEYIGSEPVHRAAWLNVLAYCCEQENGGRIVGARAWKDRQWQQTCGVALDEVVGAAPLLEWDGNDLVVWEYPLEKEEEVQAKRKGGSKGGKRRATLAAKHSQDQTLKDAAKDSLNSASSSASSSASTEGEGKGNGKEGEGNGKRKGTPTLPAPEARGATASPSLGNGTSSKSSEGRTPTTEPALRIAALYHRRASTEWSEKEIRSFKKLVQAGTLDSLDDLALVERYTKAEMDKPRNKGIHRRDLLTFLNNFSGELDRARAWEARNTSDAPKKGAYDADI